METKGLTAEQAREALFTEVHILWHGRGVDIVYKYIDEITYRKDRESGRIVWSLVLMDKNGHSVNKVKPEDCEIYEETIEQTGEGL